MEIHPTVAYHHHAQRIVIVLCHGVRGKGLSGFIERTPRPGDIQVDAQHRRQAEHDFSKNAPIVKPADETDDRQ